VNHFHLHSKLLSSSASRMPSWHSMLSTVSAVRESKGCISPSGSATWLSDVGGCSLKIGNRSRNKVSYLIPTQSRCLDRFYSLSLFTDPPPMISRDRTCTVCHTTTQVLADLAGIGTTAYSPPKSFPMRLARDMPRDWQISQRVSSSSLNH
jgi:hypothetical protein